MQDINTTNDLDYLLDVRLPPQFEAEFRKELIKLMDFKAGVLTSTFAAYDGYDYKGIINYRLNIIRKDTIAHEFPETTAIAKAVAVMGTQEAVNKKLDEVLELRRKYINQVPPLEREFLTKAKR